MIIGKRQPTIDAWVFSLENHPFKPISDLNAVQLSEKSLTEVHHLLHLNAQEAKSLEEPEVVVLKKLDDIPLIDADENELMLVKNKSKS
jgi:hypothetical protein